MERRIAQHTLNESTTLSDGLLEQFMANNAGFVDMQDAHREIHNLFLQSMQSTSNASKESCAQIMQTRDERISKFLLSASATQMKSSQTSREFFNGNRRKDQEVVRSSSLECGWVNHQLVSPTGSVQKLPASASALPVFPHNRHIFPRFGSFGGFPGFSHMPGSMMNGEQHFKDWTKNSEMYTSNIEYHMQMSSSSSSEQTAIQSQHLQYDDSESDSDEEEMFAVRSSGLDAIEFPTRSGSELESKLGVLAIEAAPMVDPRKERAFRLANELCLTEESYVKILFLIDQVFHFRVDQENRAHAMFPQEMIPQMFSNIKSIYKFHSEFLLPQLKTRISNWEKDPRIGDIMKNFAPFLKMYTEYVRNFDNAMNVIHAIARKNKRFSDIMNEIQKMDECGHLTLAHHMLCPIQRIPRYEMLLKDYLKKLPDGSVDREDTEKALHLVSTAANHVNETMKKIDKFKHLLELEEDISGAVALVSPTRELLKEGKMAKISARSGDHQERYLFLFSDQLLLCSIRLLPNRVISGPTYKLRAKFTLDNIEWCEGDNLETTNTFYIRDSTKNVELYTQSVEEKLSWRDTLIRAIQELYARKASLKVGSDSELELGRKPPKRIKLDGVTKCTECESSFGVMKRKHHCHTCGLVFCSKCLNQKHPLAFEDGKLGRVCKNCFEILTNQSGSWRLDQRSEGSSDEKARLGAAGDSKTAKPSDVEGVHERKGVLDVQADAACVQSGYLQLKTLGKPWVRRWFSLHSDFVLYSFVTNKDQQAATATPLPGFTVARVTSLKGESTVDKDRLFKIFHSKKTYFFHANTKDEVEKWLRALEMSSQAELPSPQRRNKDDGAC